MDIQRNVVGFHVRGILLSDKFKVMSRKFTIWWLISAVKVRSHGATSRRDMLQGHVAGSNFIVCHRSKPCRGTKNCPRDMLHEIKLI